MQEIIEEDLGNLKNNLKEFRESIEGKTFLVTGGAGFIGSWFCDILNEFNAKIICVDDLSSGSKKNIEHLIGNENFKFIQADICNFGTDEKIDYIVHMASIASPPLYQKYPIKTLDSNVIGTKEMLELAKKNNVKAFLFTSTSEVYGNPESSMIPTPENYYGNVNSFGPRSMYDEGKRAAESYCFSYFKQFHIPIRIARVFNTYGPRMDFEFTSYGRVLVRFIVQALSNENLTVHERGQHTRSFCYITDMIEALLKLLLKPDLDGLIVNIGNDKEIHILDLANIIIQYSNTKSKPKLNSEPNYDLTDNPFRRCPDISRAKKLLNFYPKIQVEEGIKRTIEWFKSN